MTVSTQSPQLNDIFAGVEKAYGWVPNLIKEMSASVPTVQVYLNGQEALAKGSLTPKEQQAVQLAVAAFNSCHYCQAAHGWIAGKVQISPEDVKAIREGRIPSAPDVAPIVETTRLLMQKRGWLTDEELREAEGKGISKTRLYEVIAYIGLKTITNYINHIAHTRVDAQFTA